MKFSICIKLTVGMLLILTWMNSTAQKKIIDFKSHLNWPSITPKKISNNGKYVVYTTKCGIDSLTIQSTDFAWKKSFRDASDCMFSYDSRLAIFRQSDQNITIVYLGSDSTRHISQLLDSKIFDITNGKWLGYRLKDSPQDLTIVNLLSGDEEHYQHIDDYEIYQDDQVILYTTLNLNNEKKESTVWLDLRSGKSNLIATNRHISNMAFSVNHPNPAIAFFVDDTIASSANTRLYYYKPTLDSAIVLFDPLHIKESDIRLSKQRDIYFNHDGSRLFFYVKKTANPKPKSSDSFGHPTIFSYNVNQLSDENCPLLRVVDLQHSNKIIPLQQVGDNPYYQTILGADNNWIVIEENSFKDRNQDSVRKEDTKDIYLVSCQDGSRKLIKKNINSNQKSFSPTEKYYVWFDGYKKQWFSYNILQSTIKNISRDIKVPLDVDNEIPGPQSTREVVGWFENDEALLVYDRFDIWKLDPNGSEAPVNLTHSYGANNNVRFTLLFRRNEFSKPFNSGDTLILSAFNLKNKQNGFYRLVLGRNPQLRRLTMASKVYYYPYSTRVSQGSFAPFLPMKANFCNFYMLECMGPNEFPNIYITKDFIKFDQLTHYQPQKQYNWFVSELHRWKLPDGHISEGILYKPENFNPRKKYPVIFFYYQQSSDALYHFIHPALSNGRINIPWFVSNGYLVFVPDIHYKEGHPGEGALNSILSAAHYLSKKTFVDTKHMGLQGHSYGGFETNYIVSRTSFFAAAAPSAGISDITLNYRNNDGQRYFELGQGRIGEMFWRRPELYLENSPIFRVKSINTPLLIMHNKMDPIVPFEQSKQLYTGLAREGKRAWMLSYREEGHTIENDESKLDYSIRLAQFFDHYLKGLPAPDWMAGDEIK